MGGRFRGCFLFLVCAKVTFQLPAFGNYDIWGDGSITDVNVLDNGDSRNSSRMGKGKIPAGKLYFLFQKRIPKKV